MNLPDEPWSVFEGTYDDHPLLVRVNMGAAALKGHPALRHRVGVAVPLRTPDRQGLPGPIDRDVLAAIERALDVALEVGNLALHVLVITTSGMREFVYHTTAPERVADALDGVTAQFPGYDIQAVQEDDPTWEVYEQFVR